MVPGLMAGAGAVHVWTVDLAPSDDAWRQHAACLSEGERQRAGALADPSARARFSIMRIALRDVLSRIIRCAPAAVDIIVDAGGKPHVAGRLPHFSLSHEAQHGVIAVADERIGVDIERVRVPRHPVRTARRILHAETFARLQELPEEERTVAFIDAWTQREAHVKAVGGGLFLTPDVLPFDPSRAADGSIHSCRDREGDTWSIARFEPRRGTRATVVVHGSIGRVHYSEWNMDALRPGGGA